MGRPPTPVTEAAICSIPLSPRFAIEEQHGGSKKKIRVIDDLQASKVNDFLGLVDTNIPQNLDTLLGMALTHTLVGTRRDLHLFSVDFAHAYKHVGVTADQMDFATAVLSGPEGVPMMETLRTQPFGPTMATANWARVTSLVQFVLQRMFLMRLGVFVDDCYCVESHETIASALWVTRERCSLLGLELERLKEQGPAASIDILEATLQLGGDLVTDSLTKQRTEDYIGLLKGIIRRKNLSPAVAAKVRGKLGFAQSMLFGKYGRPSLYDFAARRYSSLSDSFTG